MSDHPTPSSPEDAPVQAAEEVPTPTAEDASMPVLEETVAPVATEKDGDAVETRTAGMRRYRRGEVEIDPGDSDGEILVVSVKLRSANGGGTGRRRTLEPEEPEVRSKVNRFATKPTPTAPASAMTAVAVNPPPPPSADDLAAPPPGAPRAKFTPRTAQGASGKTAWEATPLPAGFKKYTILTLVMLGVGFMAGRHFGQSAAPAPRTATTQTGAQVPKLTTTWAPGRLAQLDALLAADERGDLKGARQMALDIKKDVPDSPELDWYLTTVQVRLNEFKIPENDLARALDSFTPPREAAAINERLGFLYARHRDFPRAVLAFSDAASTDPFNPMHFQHWAESERRQGHLQDAVERFRQALVRLPVGTPSNSSRREEIGLKIRLAQIEMGKDQDVKAEIDAQLKAPTPNGYWLLTAAGYGLQHGDMTLAISSLQKARATLSADDYNALTNDYFFHSFAGGPDVAGLLPSDTPAARVQPFQPRMGYFIDP